MNTMPSLFARILPRPSPEVHCQEALKGWFLGKLRHIYARYFHRRCRLDRPWSSNRQEELNRLPTGRICGLRVLVMRIAPKGLNGSARRSAKLRATPVFANHRHAGSMCQGPTSQGSQRRCARPPLGVHVQAWRLRVLIGPSLVSWPEMEGARGE